MIKRYNSQRTTTCVHIVPTDTGICTKVSLYHIIKHTNNVNDWRTSDDLYGWHKTSYTLMSRELPPNTFTTVDDGRRGAKLLDSDGRQWCVNSRRPGHAGSVLTVRSTTDGSRALGGPSWFARKTCGDSLLFSRSREAEEELGGLLRGNVGDWLRSLRRIISRVR